jgi:hypothetical protein
VGPQLVGEGSGLLLEIGVLLGSFVVSSVPGGGVVVALSCQDEALPFDFSS